MSSSGFYLENEISDTGLYIAEVSYRDGFLTKYRPILYIINGEDIIFEIDSGGGITTYPSFPTSNIYSRFNFHDKSLYIGNANNQNVFHRVPEIENGYIDITPSAANTPTGKSVAFSNQFSDIPSVVATPYTAVPGTAVLGVGVSSISKVAFTAYVTRTNTNSTGVRWIAMN